MFREQELNCPCRQRGRGRLGSHFQVPSGLRVPMAEGPVWGRGLLRRLGRTPSTVTGAEGRDSTGAHPPLAAPSGRGAGHEAPTSPKNTEAQRSQGTSGVDKKATTGKTKAVPTPAARGRFRVGPKRPVLPAPPATSSRLRCLQLMKVLLHKAARYAWSLFQLFICLLGGSFPYSFPPASATLL